MTTIARSALHKISDELWEIAHANWKGFDHWAEEVDAGLLDAPRVRELGEQANRLGGFAAMSAVCKQAFYDRLDGPDDALARAAVCDLNYRWHGIGDWQH